MILSLVFVSNSSTKDLKEYTQLL